MPLDSFNKLFARRTIITYFVITVLFFGTILRLAALSLKTDYQQVQKQQSSFRLTVSKQRGTIYDRNMIPLTNRKTKIVAAVMPTPRAITAISGVLSGKELESALERLKKNQPVLCEVPEFIECDGIYCTTVYENSDEYTPAVHLIGYTDIDLKGVSGLQKAYDEVLFSESEVSFVFTQNALGGILEGISPEIENNTSVPANGIVSTIDINIQTIAEIAASNLKSGAVVIADSNTSKIRAMVSVPTFNPNKITDYLKAENSPLINRAISSFNVGSAFKPCVAVAAIENGLKSFDYTCLGKCKIIDRYFKCHNLSGHGKMNLRSGLANSCNTYFYNMALELGGDNIYNTASAFGFGKSLEICNGIKTSPGSLPERETLRNFAHLANLSIGQGELLLSPVSILTLYCSIASDGSYNIPSVIEGTLKDGSLSPYQNTGRTRAMSKSTAKLLKEQLSAVIEEGTGKTAKPTLTTAAGKTATAQTGKFKDGAEICQGWFCGFFPAENPKYTVIVFSENTAEEIKSTSEIFAEIADKITELETKKEQPPS